MFFLFSDLYLLMINHPISDTARTSSLLPSHKFLPAWEMSETTTSPSHMYLLQGEWPNKTNLDVSLSDIYVSSKPSFLLIWGEQKLFLFRPALVVLRNEFYQCNEIKDNTFFQLQKNITFCFCLLNFQLFLMQMEKDDQLSHSNKVCVFIALKILKVRHTFPCQLPRLHTIFMSLS